MAYLKFIIINFFLIYNIGFAQLPSVGLPGAGDQGISSEPAELKEIKIEVENQSSSLYFDRKDHQGDPTSSSRWTYPLTLH